MKKIILNHKMNLTVSEIVNHIDKLQSLKKDIIVCPSSIYSKMFIDNGFSVGLQNVYCENEGAFTGEISPYQANKLGVEYVLIGHSERRKLFGEDKIINKKIKKALENNLKIILCVGEGKGENAKEVLYKQITTALADVDANVIIAYEPVYSIGTGDLSNDIEDNINYIKSLIDTEVLYGGSVNSKSIVQLNKINNIDGFLVGSASLSIDEVTKILEVVC